MNTVPGHNKLVKIRIKLAHFLLPSLLSLVNPAQEGMAGDENFEVGMILQLSRGITIYGSR